MHKPDADSYLHLFARAMPDPVATMQHLGASVTLIQTAMEALGDDEAENVKRAQAALAVVLSALVMLGRQYEQAADWLASNSWAEAARRVM